MDGDHCIIDGAEVLEGQLLFPPDLLNGKIGVFQGD